MGGKMLPPEIYAAPFGAETEDAMTTGQKIAKLRRARGMTQDGLADALGVSRQAVSKWESDAAFPETEKLVRLSRLLECSIDYLLKQEGEPAQDGADAAPPQGGRQSGAESRPAENCGSAAGYPPFIRFGRYIEYEYKSSRTVRGIPLVHINLGWGRTAKGIVAIGFKARGVVSVGFLSMGALSFGCLSLGLLSVGALSLGVLSLGAIAAGLLLALGAVAVGFVAYGAVAVGFFSAGALAVAQYVAVGDYAFAAVPIGKTFSSGGMLYDFYMAAAQVPPFAQVGYYQNGAFVEGEAALRQACADLVPRAFRWLADLFCGYRLYP